MDVVKATSENQEEATAGEQCEFGEMYPPMVATAEEECDRRATLSMRNAMEVEKLHDVLFNDALAAVKSGEDLAETPVPYVPGVRPHRDQIRPRRMPGVRGWESRFRRSGLKTQRQSGNLRVRRYRVVYGAGDRNRTRDLLITNQLLYLLSYASNVDVNPRPAYAV